MTWIFWTGLALLAVWGVLVFRWHGFWRMEHVLPPAPSAPPGGRWPSVAAVVPARNEEACVQRALFSLAAQDYPGDWRVFLVNDGSEDATGRLARAAAEASGGRIAVIDAPSPPPGWAGKVAAMDAGVRAAQEAFAPEYFWFTDADIEHAPDALRRLAAAALAERTGLTSALVRLHCESFWERLLIPAFIYFFFLLYPPAAVARPEAFAAGAAGGCMLVRADALSDIGGLESIRGAVIDDCALARRIKDRGWRVWLGLSDASRSLRAYDGLGGLWAMVARSAYAQLHYNPALLLLSLAGVGFAFVLPALYAAGFVLGDAPAHFAGLVAFGLLTASCLPVTRHCGLSRRWALALPLAAAFYAVMTASSALLHVTGRGIAWRGRRPG